MLCQYCDQVFSRKYNLEKHQNTHKFCIRIRLLSEKLLTEKQHTQHLSDIVSELNDEVSLLRHENEQLAKENQELLMEYKITSSKYDEVKQTNKDLFEKATSKTDNNTTNNYNLFLLEKLDPIPSPEEIAKIINDEMTLTHVRSGQRGMAQFVSTNILNKDGKQYYVITDSSRLTGCYKEDGRLVKDPKLLKLTKWVKDPFIEKAQKIVDEEGICVVEFPTDCDNAESRGIREISYVLDEGTTFIKEMSKHVEHV